MDINKSPELISGNMTIGLCAFIKTFHEVSWMVQPPNYLLLACHASNETV
ncbi:Mitochondrial pyruvate carrier 1 [Bienertia sinuspersici]